MKKTVNTRIKELRIALSMSQTEFAYAINLSHSLLSKIESTDRDVSNKIVDNISETFKVDINWLLKGIGEMTFTKPSKAELTETNTPWKDEAYQLLKSEVLDLREKHNQAMQMVSKMIDRMSLGKHKGYSLTAKDKTRLLLSN